MKQVKKQQRRKGEPKLYSEKEKEYIQGTNDSSIVSKYSAERIYSNESISYFTPFVGEDRVRRRSPIINRGYWLRMQCVEHVVRCFLSDCSPGRRKVVVNLGCGYDPLPFQFLSQGFRDNIIYVDIDYPALISIKAQKVSTDPLLTPLLHNIHLEAAPTDNAHIRLRSDEYFAIGCDLEQLDWLNALFEKEGFLSSEILFTAEVSVTYMRTEPANALINWAAGLPKAKFSLLEQIIPDGPQNPFARTMLKHFDTLKTPLRSVKKYPTLQDQVNRFISNRWHSVYSSDLLGFWTNTITKSEKEHLWSSEGFDEWEEFYLFAQHYCLLLADNNEASTGLQDQFFKPVAEFGSIKGGDVFSSHRNSKSNEKTAPVAQEQNFKVKTIGTQSKKFLNRFGATDSLTKSLLLHYGGLSISGRIGTVAKISCDGIITEEFSKDSSPKARMCHTFTRIDQHTVLLYGGRTSPTQALGDTWIFDGQQWKLVSPEAESFPPPRFRHCAVSNGVQKNVLIFGGVGEGQKILGDWHVFNYETQRWTQLNVVSHSGDVPSPRFSASMCAISENTALLVGGISEDGVVLHDMWKVTWSDSQVITECITIPPDAAKLLWRFGAQLVKTAESEVLFIGGVSGGSLMRKSETVVVINMKDEIKVEGAYGLLMELSPLLVGFTAGVIGETMVLVGGGAVCFSFGAEWNGDLLAISRDVKKIETAIYKEPIAESPAPGGKLADIQTSNITPLLDDRSKPFPILNNIQRIRISSENDFAALLTKAEPVILEGIGFGSCVEKWNWEYLKTQVGVDRQIIVHSSSTSQMSFTTKNFTYEKTTFGAFVDAISNSTSSSTPGLYLRSLSSTSPTKHPANLTIDFPNLSQDFEIPPELSFVKEHLHSSPLRISSANVGMWLHFDVTANVLFHVSGTKRFRLWHPRRALELGFPPGGSSSATLLDPFADLSSTPASDSNVPLIPPDYDIILSPGSALYIPPVYPHAALPLSPCVAVNVFFRDLPKERYAPGKDVYGNRDLAAYEKGRLAMQKVLKDFEGLPEWVRRFYLERLGAEIIDAARKE